MWRRTHCAQAQNAEAGAPHADGGDDMEATKRAHRTRARAVSREGAWHAITVLVCHCVVFMSGRLENDPTSCAMPCGPTGPVLRPNPTRPSPPRGVSCHSWAKPCQPGLELAQNNMAQLPVLSSTISGSLIFSIQDVEPAMKEPSSLRNTTPQPPKPSVGFRAPATIAFTHRMVDGFHS